MRNVTDTNYSHVIKPWCYPRVGDDGYGPPVPRISSFYGIVILMYFNDHDPPHFHAVYGEHQIRARIESLEPMDEGLPGPSLRLVLEWATLHRDELMANWEKARAGRPLDKIEPLP